MVESLLRKYLWAVDLAAIALCATILGQTAASLPDVNLASMPVFNPATLRAPQPEREPGFDKNPEAILKRNLFCSSCASLLDRAGEGGSTELDKETRTTLPLTLLAIMCAPRPHAARWSLAVMRDVEVKSIGAYRVGGTIHGATVTKILETRIYLDHQGRNEYLDLFAPPAPISSPAASTTRKDVDPLAAELERGIKKVGQRNYEIQRSTLEAVLGDIALVSQSARAVPEIRDGKATGFRLFAVRPEGAFGKIGMQSGDIVTSINGLELTSPEKALEVYAKLKSASHLSLGMVRDNQQLTNEYNIR